MCYFEKSVSMVPVPADLYDYRIIRSFSFQEQALISFVKENPGTMNNKKLPTPNCDPMPTHDNALPVSCTGNHLDTTRMLFGYVPDSPIPNRNRTTIREIRPLTSPVTAVKSDHQRTIRINTFLGPIRSPTIPDGISNTTYASANAASTQPNCSLFRCRSDFIRTPTMEMQMRSRYVSVVSEQSNTRTRKRYGIKLLVISC